MTIKQLSIFLENKSGRLTDLLDSLGKEKINITAVTIADTSEYGIARLIVSDPEKAYKLLKDQGFSVHLTDVLSIATPIEAGSFARAFRIFSGEGISIEYMYGFSLGNRAMIVFRAEDNQKALEAIQKHKLELIRESDLYEF